MFKAYSFYILRCVLLIVIVLFSDTSLYSQLEKSLLDKFEYRSVGPSRGGRSSTAVGVAGQDFTFYMGTTGGGVWKTTDAGVTWNNISDKDIKCGSIGAIAVAPSDPNVVYVGTGSPDPRGNVSMGIGVFKSSDGGESWKSIGLNKAGQIGKIIVHPNNPDEVWIGVLGNIFGHNEERGVYHSIDGGMSWEKVLYINEKTGCIDLVIDPSNPRIIYAGMWTVQRLPWTLVDGSEDGGVWKSIDGGTSWEKVENGLPTGIVGRIGIAISPANPQRLWVIQEAKDEKQGGVFRSDDGGKSFERINRDHKLRQRAWYYTRITADPKDENKVYVNNVGFYRSIDGGKTFQRRGTPHSDNHGLWINPDKTNIMIQVNDGGANVSLNGGETWSSQNNQPTSEFYRVSVDNQFPYRIYGAQQDNSTISVPSISIGALTQTSDWEDVGGGESGHIAVDPRDPGVIYAGTYIGTITRMDREKGIVDNINAYPQMHDGQAARDIENRFQWNAPIRISHHDPNVVYHCSQYVHKTTDGGKTWKKISPDLTTNKDEYQDIPGGPVQHDHTGVELYTTIFAFEESTINKGELWAGTDDGMLHLSMDAGKTWLNITPDDIPIEGTINSIDLSLHKRGRATIAVYKYRQNDMNPYIFLTNDYGNSWKLLTNGNNGIAAPHFTRVVREDPTSKGLFYAGTEFGMYVSFDDGDHWQPFQLNMPVTPITDLVVHNDDLVISTQGRSFWVMDDLNPLRRITKKKNKDTIHLIPPSDPIRFQVGRRSGFDYGARIFFYLNEILEDQLFTLSIKDEEGKVRKVYSTKPKKDSHEEKIKVTKGLNKIVWNLKYEALEPQPGSFFSLANTGGIKAPTGDHSVELRLGDKVLKESFEIKMDPRWEISHGDLRAQYELGMQIKETFNMTHQKIGDIRSIRKQIKSLSGYAKGHANQDTIERLAEMVIKKLNDQELKLIQIKNESGQDPINYPSMIDDQLAYLYSVVNSLEGRPGHGAYQRYQDLITQLKPLLKELDEIIDVDTQHFSQLIADSGLGGIIIDK